MRDHKAIRFCGGRFPQNRPRAASRRAARFAALLCLRSRSGTRAAAPPAGGHPLRESRFAHIGIASLAWIRAALRVTGFASLAWIRAALRVTGFASLAWIRAALRVTGFASLAWIRAALRVTGFASLAGALAAAPRFAHIGIASLAWIKAALRVTGFASLAGALAAALRFAHIGIASLAWIKAALRVTGFASLAGALAAALRFAHIGIASLAWIRAAVLRKPVVAEMLRRAGELGLPQWYLTAGCLFQTAWNPLHGFPVTNGIRDYDLFYFDASDLSWEAEDAASRRSADAFAMTTCCVAIRRESAALRTYAPHGFGDQFNLMLRPNPVRAPRAVYEEKARQCMAVWPGLRAAVAGPGRVNVSALAAGRAGPLRTDGFALRTPRACGAGVPRARLWSTPTPATK